MPHPILLLLAHPAVKESRIHSRLVGAAAGVHGVTLHNLYAAYPDFRVDAAREQALLARASIVLMQHPLYWYSSPALLKEWQDVALDYGFAYGERGTALHGKALQQVVTTGGAAHAFTGEGESCSMEDLLKPFEQTARKCGMRYLPPYVIHGAGRLSDGELEREAARYRAHLEKLATSPA